MSEEKFHKSDSDEITQRIVDRLGERQRKLDQMSQWEVQSSRKRTYRLFVVPAAIAASLLVGLMLPLTLLDNGSPLDRLGISAPTMTVYRAAYPEMDRIDNLIGNNQLDSALCVVEEALRKSDLNLSELEKAGDDTDEELAYEREFHKSVNSELRWAYIYLLVQSGSYEEAGKQLERYLQNESCGTHEKEAKALYEEILKK